MCEEGPSQSQRAQQQDVSIDGEVSARLFASYLANIHPIWPIIYMPCYEQGRYGLQQNFFSQPVLYAIYAIAACTERSQGEVSNRQAAESYVPSPNLLFESALLAMQRHETGQASLSGRFHPLNMLRPSIESCQALVILTLQQHGLGEASNAAILCSIAAGMAIDLRLNEALPADSDHTTVQIASRLWWNLFILDKMLETERGRPFRLRSEDVTTPWPSTSEADEFQLIKVPDASTGRQVTIKTYSMSGFEKTIQLAIVMENIGREVCSVTSKRRICADLQAAEKTRIGLWRKLDEYQQSLQNSNIAIEKAAGFLSVVPPVAVINAIWTSACMILLNRPFAQYWQDMQWSGDKDVELELHPKYLCVQAATKISAILSSYRGYLTSFPCDIIFPIVLSAAVIWQFCLESERESGEEAAREQLDQCVQCLSIVNSSWKNAGRYRAKLMTEIRRSSAGATPATNASILPGVTTSASPPEASTTFAILDFLGDRTDGLCTQESDFRDFLETRLSRLSSPVPTQ